MMYLLHIDLNVFLQAVAVQVQHQVMDEIKAIAHNNQRQLVSQLGFLQNGNDEKFMLAYNC